MQNYLELTFNNFIYKPKIACFDLDGTIIKTKSGKTHPIDENDWLFNYDTTIDKLKEYSNKDYCIIFITNQRGLIKKNQVEIWKNKINHINEKLDLPLKVFASLADDIYRKPNIGLWNIIKTNINPDYNTSFYCGDAIGRNGDFSDCDFKLAKNLGLLFYSPEQIFLDSNYKYNHTLEYYNFDNNIPTNNYDNIKFKLNNELVLFVGFPGSGKSSMCKKIFNNTFVILSLDNYKNKNKLLKDFEKYCIQNINVVIDNTNPSIESRKLFIDIGKKYNYNITCLNMKTDELLAKHNNYFRYLYENKTLVPTLVYNIYKKKYKVPNISEGINNIIDIYPEYNNASFYKFYLF